jgi:hypothetical protein
MKKSINELITLRAFNNSNDFEIAKSYLESFEIECFGQDENMTATYWTGVVGGVKLQVGAEQAEEAIKLLFEAGYLKKEDFEPSSEMKWMEKILSYFKR